MSVSPGKRDQQEPEQPTSKPETGSLSAQRRQFLKVIGVAGIAAAALWVSPRVTSVHARPAYAAATPTPTAVAVTEVPTTATKVVGEDPTKTPLTPTPTPVKATEVPATIEKPPGKPR